MKTKKVTITVLAVLMITNFAWASGNVKLSVKPSEKDMAFVEISKKPLSEVELEVKDEYGDVVFYKKISEPMGNYMKKYDFSALDDGNYTLSVNSENEVNEARLLIERGMIKVEKESKFMEPHFHVKDNIFKMSYLNFPMESTDLYVYDGSTVLYHKKIKPEFAIHEGLDLSNLLPGEYQIFFADGQNSYEHIVNVK